MAFIYVSCTTCFRQALGCVSVKYTYALSLFELSERLFSRERYSFRRYLYYT